MNKKFAVNFLFLANQRVLFKQGRQGEERLGKARCVEAGRAGNGWAGTGSVRIGRRSEARFGMVRSG